VGEARERVIEGLSSNMSLLIDRYATMQSTLLSKVQELQLELHRVRSESIASRGSSSPFSRGSPSSAFPMCQVGPLAACPLWSHHCQSSSV
jgi:hypothetical protein